MHEAEKGVEWRSCSWVYQKNKRPSRQDVGRPSVTVAPRAGLEPATSRLQVPRTFRLGLDYLFTRLRIRRGCRALLRLIGWVPQPLVSARSCLRCPEEKRAGPSAGFAQDYHSNGMDPSGQASLNSPDVSTTVSRRSCSEGRRIYSWETLSSSRAVVRTPFSTAGCSTN